MSISGRAAVSFHRVKLPSFNFCVEKSRELMAKERETGERDLNAASISRLVITQGGEGLTPSERKSLPWFVLDPRFEEFNPEFGEVVLRTFSSKHSFWPKMFRAWLLHYDTSSKIGQSVRKSLSANKSSLGDRLIDIDSTFNVLSSKPKLYEIAGLVLDEKISREELHEINFSMDGVSGGAFSNALLLGFAKYCMNKPLTDSQLKVLIEILCPQGSIHESVREFALVSLIYGSRESSRESAGYLKAKDLIDNNYHDPRVNVRNWPKISDHLGGDKTRDHCINTVKQWHIFQSITLFFKLIEEVVEGTEHDHQFPQRREFWIDYFNKGLVTEAWVILGTKGNSEALRYQQSGDSDFAKLIWAKLSSAKNDQCVLLMQIGNAKVVEWSHSGACRVWRNDDPNAPSMLRKRYDGGDLRATVADEKRDRIVHDKSGRWRARIIQRVNAYSGLRRFV
jgi:hypothetical protein